MSITDSQLTEIENTLIRFIIHKAFPRFMRDLRRQIAENRYGESQIKDPEFVIQEFAEWLQYGGHAAPPYDESITKNGTERTPT